jgi:hypothetical protein
MKISFERHGGFTGIRLATQIDTETMEPGEAHQVQEMVAAADFFNLPAVILPSKPGPDEFQYIVTVEMGDRQHTVTVSDRAAPPALQELLQFLTRMAKKRRGTP